MKTTKITPRFEPGQKVIAKENRLVNKGYTWMTVAKVEVYGFGGKVQPYYYFFGTPWFYGEDEVFASEEELFEKTGEKLNQYNYGYTYQG